MYDADVDAESDHNVPADEVPVPDHIFPMLLIHSQWKIMTCNWI